MEGSLGMAGGELGCVVVAVDDSEESMRALRWALHNLRLRSPDDAAGPGSLVVLHVQPPPSLAAGVSPAAIPFGGPSHVVVPAFPAAIEAHERRISDAIIDHALQICSESNIPAKTEVVVGDPKDVICDVTDKLKADLLVMGCRDYGAIRRMFIGSVSNYCVNNVRCPVMVIKKSS